MLKRILKEPLGLERLAIICSLPYVLLMWGYVGHFKDYCSRLKFSAGQFDCVPRSIRHHLLQGHGYRCPYPCHCGPLHRLPLPLLLLVHCRTKRQRGPKATEATARSRFLFQGLIRSGFGHVRYRHSTPLSAMLFLYLPWQDPIARYAPLYHVRTWMYLAYF